MYGQQKLDLSEGGNRLYQPGVFDGELAAIEERQTTTQKDVLVFVLRADDGRVYDHTEWPQDDPKKMKNQLERIGVIMSRFIDEGRVATMTGVTDWLTYRKFVINTVGTANKGVSIQFKLVPDTWDEENPKVKFPLYKGALIRKDSERYPLKLSKKETEEIAVYKDLLTKKLANQNGADSMPSVADQATSGGEEPAIDTTGADSPIY
jgi:hypothetical protein